MHERGREGERERGGEGNRLGMPRYPLPLFWKFLAANDVARRLLVRILNHWFTQTDWEQVWTTNELWTQKKGTV